MFTGIIEEIGTIRGIKRGNRSVVLEVQAKKVLEDLHVGDSIATNGVCLTVAWVDISCRVMLTGWGRLLGERKTRMPFGS